MLQNGAVIWVLQIEIDQMVQLATVQKTSPNSKSSVDSPCRLPCVANAPKRSTAQIRPRRMTHAPCFTINVQEAINFYSRVLGLRMSDKSGDGVCVAFMAVATTCSHLRNQEQRASIICSWDVGSIEEMMFPVCHELKSLMSVHTRVIMPLFCPSYSRWTW